MGRHLEWRYPRPDPLPKADCILILGGGTVSAASPRSTVEINDAGDRILFGAYLFKNGLAPRIICTSGVSKGGFALRAPAYDMAELLEVIGVPQEVIVLETLSGNTREHARNLNLMLETNHIKQVLLVTSAAHMPRSMGVFRKYCPRIEFFPLATDYRVTEHIPVPWYRELAALIPTPSNLVGFSYFMHESLGITYYQMRGWI